MGCMGPSHDKSLTEHLFNEILVLLKDYGIQDRDTDFIMIEIRDKLNKNLKNAIDDIVFQQECEDF
jgi:hypothetical protein